MFNIEVLDERCKPFIGSSGAGGIDLRARVLPGVPPSHLGEGVPDLLLPNVKYTFGLGIKTNIPEGWVALVAPRSGLGFNYEVTLANTVGVIDSDYEGEWRIALVVRGSEPMPFTEFDRICQMIVVPHYDYSKVVYRPIDKKSDRGTCGFGSSGVV